MDAAPALEATLALEEGEVAAVGIGDEHDVSAVAAVSPVGPAFGHVLLTPEAQRAVASTAATHLDAGAIVEHGCPS
jgi:hypothetical protein